MRDVFPLGNDALQVAALGGCHITCVTRCDHFELPKYRLLASNEVGRGIQGPNKGKVWV
jgi:hypothetical protein